MDSSDESVCDYEKKRMKTMEENSELLQSLGEPYYKCTGSHGHHCIYAHVGIDIIKRKQVSGATARNKRRTVQRGVSRQNKRKYTQCNISSSSDSEEDWFPGMEENNRGWLLINHILIYIQWNLRVRDILGPAILSLVGRLSSFRMLKCIANTLLGYWKCTL